jgi:2-dehydro-3-deoxy-D-arabinonate dehydratase
MKLYKTNSGIIIENDTTYFLLENENWDEFVNDDQLFAKMRRILQSHPRTDEGAKLIRNELMPPIGSQEIWAAGVTYYRSKVGRQEESKNAGGGDFYARVYEAERPEIFFKNTAHRTVGCYQAVRIRQDSTWNVPEPELTLMVTRSGKIVGYTIGNDMSSRSIEGENPLYLPQAKCYDKSASIGPCIWVTDAPLPSDTEISIEVRRNGIVFEGKSSVGQIKRSLNELVSYLYKESSFPQGCLFMTGTGVVPPNEFTLQRGDEIRITIGPIGTLTNTVE